MTNPGKQACSDKSSIGFAAIVLATLAGCATASIEDAVPVAATVEAAPVVALDGSAAATTPGAVAVQEAAIARGPSNTGTFPNLNIAPQVAAPAFTDRERDVSTREIQTARKGQDGRGDAEGAAEDNDKLKRLVKTHAEETLEAIEKPSKVSAPTPPDDDGETVPATN